MQIPNYMRSPWRLLLIPGMAAMFIGQGIARGTIEIPSIQGGWLILYMGGWALAGFGLFKSHQA